MVVEPHRCRAIQMGCPQAVRVLLRLIDDRLHFSERLSYNALRQRGTRSDT